MMDWMAWALLIVFMVAFIFGIGVEAGRALGYEQREREVTQRELDVLDECLAAWKKEL